MKRFPLVCALTILCTATALAQSAGSSRYRFDNFDTSDGIRIEVPPQQQPNRHTRQSRKRLKLTARTAASKSTPPARTTPAPTPKLSAAPASAHTTYLPPSDAKSLGGYSTGNASVDRFIVDSSTHHGVDPLLIYSVMHRESSFKRYALSHKGARGLMQLMPATARRFGVRDIFDPQQNIEGGTRYMRFLLDLFDGDVRLALAGYNAGEGAVKKYGHRVPPYRETQEYVRRITERYGLIRDPSTARTAPRVSRSQIAKLKASEPPTILYETSIGVVRTPDGKLRLVSQ